MSGVQYNFNTIVIDLHMVILKSKIWVWSVWKTICVQCWRAVDIAMVVRGRLVKENPILEVEAKGGVVDFRVSQAAYTANVVH